MSKPAESASAPAKKRTAQGVFCAWHGATWGVWRALLAQEPALSPDYRLRRFSISMTALSNSFWAMLERAIYGARVARVKIEHPPVFILGHWRSGTTLLHNLMMLDKTLTYPNLYQTLFLPHFLLTESVLAPLTQPLIPKTRPMDNVETGWKMPQEDELALLLTTLVSPYLMLAHQGNRARYERFFDLTDCTAEELAAWKESFLLMARKLTYLQNKSIVFKSPSHTYRVPLFLEMFPDAKFIYIYRDPYAVYSSSVHLRRTIFEENAISRPNHVGTEEDMLLTYEHAIRRYESTKHLIPAGNLVEVRFEDLEADPLGKMREIYSAINLPNWSGLEPEIQKILPDLLNYKKNAFRMDPKLKAALYERLKFAFDLYGYPSRLDEVATPSGG